MFLSTSKEACEYINNYTIVFIISIVQHFVIGFLVSFLGTLPPGTINIEAIRLGMQQSVSVALRFIMATLIAEFVYTLIAIHFSGYLMSFPRLEFYITLLTVPVFLIIGISYFYIKPAPPVQMEVASTGYSVFWKGLVLGAVNPLQVPFWLTWASYFLSLGWIKQDGLLLSVMTLGALLGSLTMLFLMARFGSASFMKKLNVHADLVNRILGIFLISLALYQTTLIYIAS